MNASPDRARPVRLGAALLVLGCTAKLSSGGGRSDPNDADDTPSPALGVNAPPRQPRSGIDAGSGGPEASGPPGPDARPDREPATALLAITFRPAVHTFTESLDVTLTASDPRARIHFTLDDTVPTVESRVSSGPIRLTSTTIVRAFAMTETGAAGPVYNHSYLKLAADTAPFTSDIPVLVLATVGPRPTAKAEGVKAGTLTVFEPGPAGRRAALQSPPTVNARMGVNVRGTTSADYEKKPYKVEIWDGAANDDADRVLLGMPAEADWVLHGPYKFDRALIRNAFVFALGNQMGRYAPRTRFAELFFSDAGGPVSFADYLGVYVVMEKIKIAKSRVRITPLKPTDNEPPNVTGGYIFQVDRPNRGEKGIMAGAGPGGVFNMLCPQHPMGRCALGAVVFDDPAERDVTPQQAAFIAGTINQFANALAAGQDYAAFIDQESWIDFHIVNVLTKNGDALRFSAFFHKDRGGKIIAGPLWDFDRSLGSPEDARTTQPTGWDEANTVASSPRVFEFGWWRALFDDAKFKAAYFARWKQLLQNELKLANLHALVDKLAAELGTEAPARNFRRWPSETPAGGSHAGELKLLKQWLTRRIQWIEGCLALPDPEACPAS